MNNTLIRFFALLCLGLAAGSILLFSHLGEEDQELVLESGPVPTVRYIAQEPVANTNDEDHPPMVQAYLKAAESGIHFYAARYGTMKAEHRLRDYPQRSKSQLLLRSPRLFTLRAQRIDGQRLRQAIDQTRAELPKAQVLSPALLYLLQAYDIGKSLENHELLLISRLLELNQSPASKAAQ